MCVIYQNITKQTENDENATQFIRGCQVVLVCDVCVLPSFNLTIWFRRNLISFVPAPAC